MTEELQKLLDQIKDLQARIQALQVAQNVHPSPKPKLDQRELEEKLKAYEEMARIIMTEPVEREVELTAVEATTASAVFGEKARDPEATILLLKAKEGVVGKIPLPNEISKRTALYRFIRKYGSAPRPGLKVRVKENERGYPQVVL